ncbi:MAG: hypothetical protein GY811_14760 [Myxococcales bacterium]|nr:hypothetical protein [Myxococcales bacterium]
MESNTITYDSAESLWSSPFPDMDSAKTLVLAFGASSFGAKAAALNELRKAYPTSQVLGCSTAGEIADTAVTDESLSVAITRFEHTQLRSTAAKVSDASQSYDSGKQIAAKLAASPGLRAILVLSEGLLVNGSELIRGMNDVLDESVLVTGGLAGDGDRFESTWVMWGAKISSGMVAAVGLYGDHVMVSHGSKGGWDAFGPERQVTRSEGNVLLELDGKPALPLYKAYLGDKASELPSSGLLFPLAIRESSLSDKSLVRTLLAVDEESQSMTFAGDIPVDWSAQLMKADFSKLVGGAEDAAKMVEETGAFAGKEHLAIAISCVGRRLVLGSRVEDEVEVVRDILPSATQLVGFYSYGELSPFASGKCDLHNQTMTLTVVSESPTPLKRPKRMSSESETSLSAQLSPVVSTPKLAVPTPPPAVPTPPPAVSTPAPSVHSHLSAVPATPSSRASSEGSHTPRSTHAPELTMSQRTVGSTTVVSLRGSIGERLPQNELSTLLRGKVALDLSGITRVTSFGVRAWLDLLADTRADALTLYFLRCSSAVVAQLGMIRGFSGNARILSFAAPYLCRSCGNTFDALLDVLKDRECIEQKRPADVTCPQCEESAVFDDHPSQYLEFAAEHLGPLSTEMGELLRDCQEAPDSSPSGRVEKDVRGNTTHIVAFDKIGESFSWERALEGAEGALHFDLSEASITGVQGRHIASAIFETLPSVESVNIEGCPEELVEILGERNVPKKITVESFYLMGACSSCDSKRLCLLTAVDVIDGTPYRACRQCSHTLEFKLSGSVASIFASAKTPAIAPERTTNYLVPVLLAAVTLTIGAVGIILLKKDNAAAPSSLNADTRTSLRVSGAEVAPVAIKTEKDSWTTDLEPAWSDSRLQKSPDGLLIVGRSTGQRTAEEAVAAARDEATHILLARIAEDLGRGALEERTETPTRSDSLTVIRKIFDRQMGDVAYLERTKAVVKEGESGGNVIAQFRISPADYAAAVAYYGSSANWRGLEVSPLFPLQAAHMAPTNGLLQITHVKRKSAGFYRRLRANDVVLSVAGSGVRTPKGFLELVKGSVDSKIGIRVQSGSLIRSVTFSN